MNLPTRDELLSGAKSIRFDTEGIKAILDETNPKTETRWPVKLKYDNTHLEMRTDKYGSKLIEIENFVENVHSVKNPDRSSTLKLRPYFEKAPPYKPGDILYVQETWGSPFPNTNGVTPLYFKADGNAPEKLNWSPSIYMPKSLARIILRVNGIRSELLQEIKVDNILREGTYIDDIKLPPICQDDPELPKNFENWTTEQQDAWFYSTARDKYIGLCAYAEDIRKRYAKVWDSKYKGAELAKYGWKANPFVWMIEFEKLYCYKVEIRNGVRVWI